MPSFIRVFAALFFLCASTASAQGRRSPAPQAAPASQAPAPALEDTALLFAILQVYEPAPPEIRALAVEDLGLLGDPRGLNVLADAALDPQPAVQQAAVRALRAFQHPRAEEILANLVRHPRPPESIKRAALEALAYQRTPSAEAILRSIRDDGRYGPHLQETAARLVARLSPPQR